jgi:DNA-binding LacI/PurR family transcriptional regulator
LGNVRHIRDFSAKTQGKDKHVPSTTGSAGRSSGRGPAPHGHVTLADVARRLGVSAQTVSNALNAPDRVAPETRDRVLAAVRELGYRPNRSAQALRSRRSRLIGVRVEPARTDRAALFLDQFLHALAESAGALDCHLILVRAADEAEELAAYRELLDAASADAFILASTHVGDRRVDTLRDWGVPFATFGRPWDRDDVAWVDVDGRAGIRAATEHVAGEGHTRIGFVGWPAGSETGADRRRGWLEGCEALGLAPTHSVEVEDDFEAGRTSAHTLLDAADAPTALVCTSDTLALGAMRAVAERGLVAGHDVAVTGFDDSSAAILTTPGLTSLRQPVERVATDLVTALRELPDGEPDRRQTLLTPQLIVRGSSSRAPH